MMGDRDGQVSVRGHCSSCERAVPLAAASATHCYSGATVLAMPFPPTHLSHCSLGGLTQCRLHPSVPLLLSHCVRLQLHGATLTTVLLTILVSHHQVGLSAALGYTHSSVLWLHPNVAISI